jgi:hypothetical protein
MRQVKPGTAIALVALVLAVSSPAFAGPLAQSAQSLGARFGKLLGLVKKNEATAKRALAEAKSAKSEAAASLAKGGPQGPQGPQGSVGPPGPKGLTGTQGPAGSAIGYTRLRYEEAHWRSDDAYSLNVDGDENVSHPHPGVFCFSGLPFKVHNIQATEGATPESEVLTVQADLPDTVIKMDLHELCPPEENAKKGLQADAVVLIRGAAGKLVDPPTSASVYVLFN